MHNFVQKGGQKSLRLSERLTAALELIPAREQDRLAEHLIKLFADDDAKWAAAFTKSSDTLMKLEAEALEAYRSGQTTVLDLEKL